MVGIELARELGLTVGDRVRISTGTGQPRPSPSRDVRSRQHAVNERLAFVALRTAQSLLERIGGVTSMEVTVEDIYEAEMIARRSRGSHR